MTKQFIILAIAAALAGCAGVPIQQTFEQYTQAKKDGRDLATAAKCEEPYPEVRSKGAAYQRAMDTLCGVTADPIEP